MVFESGGVRWNADGLIPVTEKGESFPNVVPGSTETESLSDCQDEPLGVAIIELR